MSRPPPTASTSSTQAQGPSSAASTNSRRASLSASMIPVSYAYGAPAVGGGKMTGTSRSRISAASRGQLRDKEGQDASDDDEDENAMQLTHSTAARNESIQSSTSRPTSIPVKQPRSSGTGLKARASTSSANGSASASASHSASAQNTSVNIATAFQQAVSGAGGARPVGVGAYHQREQKVQPAAEDLDEGDDGSGKETHVAGGAAGTPASKKRKKSTADKGVTASSSDDDLALVEAEARGAPKRTRRDGSVSGGAKTSPGKGHTRRKSSDKTYKPSGETSHDSDASDSDDTPRRRRSKSKGKGRASSSGPPNAIPIGRRDSEVWYGSKKRKGRKSVNGSRSTSVEASAAREDVRDDQLGMEQESIVEERDGANKDARAAREDRYGSGRGLDAGDHPDFDDNDTSGETQPASTSYFLRLKSPPSSAAGEPPTSPARSPFRALSASVDPAFAEFDQSLDHDSRTRRDTSIDASTSDIRGSSYDYSEEERFVTAAEEARRRPQASASSRTKSGAAVGVRKRLPGPLSRQEPSLDGIREEGSLPASPATPVAPGSAEFQEHDFGQLGEALGRQARWLLGKLSAWTHNPLLDWKRIWQFVACALLLVSLLSSLRSGSSKPPPGPSRWSGLNPFGSSPTEFTAPAAPANSIIELANRLAVLEGAVGDLSSISHSERTASKADRHLLTQLNQQITTLETALARERENAARALSSRSAGHTKEAKELERTLKTVRGDLDSVVSRVRGLSDDRQADAKELQHLHATVQHVSKDIAALGSRVSQVAKDVQNGVDAERISAIALEAIEARLPDKMAVRIDASGKPEVDPAFWQYLRAAFVDKKDVEQVIATQMAKLPRDASTAPPQLSWNDFISANEASLRDWISSDLSTRAGSDAIITKRTFLDMLRREIKLLKADFETKANENVEKIGQEILNKVVKQDEMRKKDSLASHLNPFHRPSSGSPQQDVTIKTADGQNVSAIVSSLVDAALLRYSKDVLARPDYALFTAGARVIRSLTSTTYEPHPVGAGRRALAWVTGTHAPRGRPPVTALHPDNSPGACWPFEGQQGQLGIHLSRRVVPSDITIEHASVDVALDGEVASAPREFELWGVVESAEDMRKLAEYRRHEHEARKAAAEATDGEHDLDDILPASIPPTPNHILIANGVYDATSSSPLQTFPVTPAARQLGIPVEVVVLRILSNYGEKQYTCLYRVRVSGTTEAMSQM